MRRFLAATKALIFIPVAIMGLLQPVSAQASTSYLTNGSFSSGGGGWSGAEGGAGCSAGKPSLGGWEQNSLNFSYVTNTVTQSVIVASPSTLTLSYSVQNRPEQWIQGQYSVSITDSNQNVSTGWQTAPIQQASSSLSITTTLPNELVTVSISGDDGPTIVWAGCYGPSIKNVTLIGELTSPPENLVWLEINENGSSVLSAPSGVFTSIYFASYGTPTGSNGQYTLGSCHSQLSQSVIEQAVLGNSSITLTASNSIFGDPCGGTYKRLYVAAVYSPVATTTTTTLPSASGGGCGPYSARSVTGATGFGGWGTGPFTDDSDFGRVVVFMGLAQPGETVWIEPYDVDNYSYYSAGSANGVSMSEWGSSWCGYQIKIMGTPTPTSSTTSLTTTTSTTVAPTTTTSTTTTSTTTTTTSTTSTTTTTVQETTTTAEETTTVPETTVEPTTTVPETSTTVQETVPEATTTTDETSTTSTTIDTPTSTTEATTTTTDPEETTTTDVPEDSLPEPTPDPQDEEEAISEQIQALVSDDATPEQVADAVEELLADGVTAEAVEEILTALEGEDVDPEIVQAIVETILAEEISAEVASELATSPEVIQNVTQEQASEIFAAIDESALTEELGAEIVAAVQDAPQEVRQAFEAQINIFGGATDTYVPVGSNVSVGVRRVVVAATAAVFVAPAAAASSRKR